MGVSKGDQHVLSHKLAEQFPGYSDSYSATSSLSQEQGDVFGRVWSGESNASTCSVFSRVSSNGFTVKNTFIHVECDEPDSDGDVYIPIRKSRSLQIAAVSKGDQ